MGEIIELLGLKFNFIQYKFGRKWFGGTYYYIWPRYLPMGIFWSDTIITSCGSEVIETETY